MPRSSQYKRPDKPSAGIRFTKRDEQILHSVHTHRFLNSDHIHALLFKNVSKRMARLRLRLLWEHEFLDRVFEPIRFAASHTHSSRPIYCLGRHGVTFVADELGCGERQIAPGGPNRHAGLNTLSHDLVATDLLISLDAACKERTDIELVSVEREHALRSRAARAPSAMKKKFRTGLMSDGSFTLRYPRHSKEWTFHIEVVRSGVKRGNKSLGKKMHRYVELNRAGYFRDIFGQEQMRAVLFVTTTEARAVNFCLLASTLEHGKRLFWFTHYNKGIGDHAGHSRFTSDLVLRPIWKQASDDNAMSLAPYGRDFSAI